jgi:hypothetical protein
MARSEKLFLRIEIAMAALLLIYVLFKAWLVPITYDEAYTIEHYAIQGIWEIMRAPAAFNRPITMCSTRCS